jgi:hypothetical protein
MFLKLSQYDNDSRLAKPFDNIRTAPSSKVLTSSPRKEVFAICLSIRVQINILFTERV